MRMRPGARFDSEHDWLTLITVSGLVLAGIIVWNLWAFGTVSSGGVIVRQTTNSASPFNTSSIATIHTIFANRAAEEAKYQTGAYRFSDPSQ